MKEWSYYKRVSLARGAFIVTLACLIGAAKATPSSSAAVSADDPPPSAWPVGIVWSKPFPLGVEFTLVMGDTRLFMVEPKQVTARAWADGSELWRRELSASTRPVADAGRIFVTSGESVHALAEETGRLEWQIPVGPTSISSTARAGWLIVPGDDGMLRGISTAQGRVVWQIELPVPLTTPVAIDGDLIVGACADGRIRGWRVLDGTIRWTREIGTRPTQVLAANGSVFVGGEDGRLLSLRQREGGINWQYRFGMPIVGQLASDERHVYAATLDNSVHAHSFNGHQAWHKLLVSRVVEGLFSDSGNVFVPQSNGEIRMFLVNGGARSGRLAPPRTEGNVIGGLASAGTGNGLRLAITSSVASEFSLTTYQRAGFGTTPATSGPPGPLLELTRPGGRP